MLHEKVALVTGAAAGIGEGIAALFAAQGAHVILCDRDAAQNEAAAAAIRDRGGSARSFTMDVTDRALVDAAVESARRSFGRVDVLVNNAGIYPRRRFVEMSEQDWDRMHDVNLKGVFHCIQAVVPHMLAQGSGKIVNISSVTFHLGTPDLSHYVATKGGVIGLTRSLAREFGDRNVHINCITPGGIYTEAEKNFVTAQQVAVFLDHQSLKRRIVPLDIARAALFLATELSDGMTGQTLNVDGGWAMY